MNTKANPSIDLNDGEVVGFMNFASSAFLAACARGEVDMNKLAKATLADRGLGLNGEWIGFDAAAKLHSA